MKKTGSVEPVVLDRYNEMLSEGGIERYPYTLFMKSNSFIPMPKVPGGTAILELDDTVRLIRNAGGIAILAHWFTYKDILNKALVKKLLVENRLDGTETDTLDLRNRSVIIQEEDAEFLIKASCDANLITTNGADAHKPGDLKLWLEKQPKAGLRSVGQTKKILQKINPSLRYSSIKNPLNN
jgi:hypothetical protein